MSLDVYLTVTAPTEVFSANITHNLGKMADAAKLYEALWRPDEIGVRFARDLVPYLEEGLGRLEEDPAKYTPLNPENGWGSYEGLVLFVRKYLIACKEHPDAEVRACR